MVDYVVGDEGVKDRIKNMRIEKIQSQIINRWRYGQKEKEKEREKKKETVVKEQWSTWNEEEYKRFKEKIKGIKLGEKEMEEGWKQIERKIKTVLEETEKGQEGTFGWNKRKEKRMGKQSVLKRKRRLEGN